MFKARPIYFFIAVYLLIIAVMYSTFRIYLEYGRMGAYYLEVGPNLTSHWKFAMDGWQRVRVTLPEGVDMYYGLDLPVQVSRNNDTSYRKKFQFSGFSAQRFQWFSQMVHICDSTAQVELACNGKSPSGKDFVDLGLYYHQLRCHLNQTGSQQYNVDFKTAECDPSDPYPNLLNPLNPYPEYIQRRIQAYVDLDDYSELMFDATVNFTLPSFSIKNGVKCEQNICVIERGDSKYVSIVLKASQSASTPFAYVKVEYQWLYWLLYSFYGFTYIFMVLITVLLFNPCVWGVFWKNGCFNPIWNLFGLTSLPQRTLKRSKYSEKQEILLHQVEV
ncbi:hypothetical protein MP228_000876 [Amoeboaphelidium protococcarum]|nr:hypothetical protein MP228_000876 [Amoeboaphelidium protococcarum]